ncbi:retron system putative HNH endonuclease [Aquitalea sp. LB_tupeE]|uniref:retron system putative HNH endonuclease n=1 Tax=Aquitalea sp. LB_tupeE TaxID=2748078 RepID=UPI0015BC344A|nr:TIGR02646 family protein [Aquitalea sp. LB_tupeE]
MLTDHKQAKPNLIAAMGEFCAYCERSIEAMHLDVEHVKPQKAHGRLALTWGNFLLACKSCNTYKRHYQDANRQTGILRNQAWPHLDNTFSAYSYDQHGRISVSAGLGSIVHQQMAQRTLEMAGLDQTPAVAASYQSLGLAYDITSRRKNAWVKAQIALAAYQQNPTDIQRQSILGQAEETGFFSIWMSVFAAHADVKCELIAIFKAAPACFDNMGNQLNPRQAGRI